MKALGLVVVEVGTPRSLAVFKQARDVVQIDPASSCQIALT